MHGLLFHGDHQTSINIQILESVVKNCGPKIHTEVANASFMEFMKNQSKVSFKGVLKAIENMSTMIT